MKNKFNFFIPDLSLIKATDAKGTNIMRLKGVASTSDRDNDGEFLNPLGFDLSYFLKNGFINWNHKAKDDASAIIGEPIKAKIENNNLYIEADLYSDSKLAKNVYELAETLNKNSKTRKLGWSIEGKVIERDLLDPTKVKKAMITGVAITPTPKNSSTWVDIMKGISLDEEFVYEASPNEGDAKNVYGEDKNSKPQNGGNYYIIDILKPNGDRIIVDKNFKIKIISKALMATQGSGRALNKESLEGALKYPEQIAKSIIIIAESHKQGLLNDNQINIIRQSLQQNKNL